MTDFGHDQPITQQSKPNICKNEDKKIRNYQESIKTTDGTCKGFTFYLQQIYYSKKG